MELRSNKFIIEVLIKRIEVLKSNSLVLNGIFSAAAGGLAGAIFTKFVPSEMTTHLSDLVWLLLLVLPSLAIRLLVREISAVRSFYSGAESMIELKEMLTDIYLTKQANQ